MINIEQLLNQALFERCVFHSEADFQHHLAWFIHQHHQDYQVRLEYPLPKEDGSSRWEYCDIVIVGASETVGIELKYKTKKTQGDIVIENDVFQKEVFKLKNQSAQDIGRYDFLKDVARLEQWTASGQHKFSSGYAILLTNDPSYWNAPKKDNTNDRAFRLHHKEISGDLSWSAQASKGTTIGRCETISLRSHYPLKWCNAPQYEFKYLLLEIKQCH